ncbi:DUF4097 family beta strand repeat-containing protein [Streptomyces sp. NPDC002054]|uniref:DUF4097 family beta strand repeat-containing protein n=1 Tax=Streptomyces sp. NPDC002054 TaxID=3154663 RepID=UPI0033258D47
MPIFVTPKPIRATVELDVGNVWIIASERTDTIVDVRPFDSSEPRDVVAAEQTRIDYATGKLVVSVPKARDRARAGGAVSLVIHLPAGSTVYGDGVAADFRCDGRLGECRLTNDCGHIRLSRTGALHLTSGLGNITVDRATGDVEVSADCGDVRIHTIDGEATVRRSKGDTLLGEVMGPLGVYVENGDIHIGRTHASVEARTSQGDVRIDETLRGPLVLETASGQLEVGIVGGTAAQLDLDARSGTVYRSLDLFDNLLGTPEQTVQVHARTVIGDIVVRRSALGLRPDEWP